MKNRTDSISTEPRYASHKQTDPGKSYKRDSFSCYIFPLFIEVLPYLNVLKKSDEGKLRLQGSYFTEDYSESQSVPENIVKIRSSGKDRLNRRTQHKRKMKKKIQRVS